MRLADFGQIMRDYRKTHHLNQEQMADLLGVQTAKHISLLENGGRNPGPKVQKRMEELLMADEMGEVLLKQDTVLSEEELEVQLTLFHKLCQLKPVKREEAVKMIYQILDMMAKSR